MLWIPLKRQQSITTLDGAYKLCLFFMPYFLYKRIQRYDNVLLSQIKLLSIFAIRILIQKNVSFWILKNIF